MTFDDFLQPMPVATFMQDYWLQKPLHLPAAGLRLVSPIDWTDFNGLLGVRGHLTAEHVGIFMNGRKIPAEHYCEGTSANPQLIDSFAAMGASIVIDRVEQALPAADRLADMLVAQFQAHASANFYASFKGVQAFQSHYDTHEVFALHCAGEKRWRIYANRADNPTEILSGEGAQADIDAFKGPVIMDVTLRPGDLLYIPRGYCHDAIATDSASLHLTFGVLPTLGTHIARWLEDFIVKDSLFRAYLPAAGDADDSALTTYLVQMGDRLREIVASPAFRDLVKVEQQRFRHGVSAAAFPTRAPSHFYALTQMRAHVERSDAGAVLVCGARRLPLGVLAEVADYILVRPAFSIEELQAKYPYQATGAISGLVSDIERLGIIAGYQPKL